MTEQTSLIPSTNLPTLEATLAQAESYRAELLPLNTDARAIVITDQATYQQVGELLTKNRGLRKQWEALWAPIDAAWQRVRDFTRTEKQKISNLAQETDGICVGKLKEWEFKERKAAEAEQKVLNKKSEQPVTVQPNLPSIAGYRKTVSYPIEVTDEDALLRAFVMAAKSGKRDRTKFLRRFVCANEKTLAQYARELKDAEAFNKEIPGVRCRKE